MSKLRPVLPHKKLFLEDSDLGKFESYVKRGSVYGWVQRGMVQSFCIDILIMGTEYALNNAEKLEVTTFINNAKELISLSLNRLRDLESNTYELVSAGVLEPKHFTLTFQAHETSMLYDVVFMNWSFVHVSPALND